MTKLMFALWGADLATSLHSEALRQALAQAGAERLQVNVAVLRRPDLVPTSRYLYSLT